MTQFPIADYLGHDVVLDTAAEFIYIGRLAQFDDAFVVLVNADAHDLRDSEETREVYVMRSREHGIRRNRTRVVIRTAAVLGLSRLDEVVDF